MQIDARKVVATVTESLYFGFRHRRIVYCQETNIDLIPIVLDSFDANFIFSSTLRLYKPPITDPATPPLLQNVSEE